MTRKINYTYIPIDYVRFYPMDWNGNNITSSNNATVTNPIWTTSSYSYIKLQLDWWASTTFTYSSATYTNSYLIKNWQVIKNSWEVSSTALSWVSWNSYQWLFLFNKTLSSEEEAQIEAYAKRRLWPDYWQTRRSQNNDFPKYSLPNLEDWKVLEISKPASWWVYYDQTGNWNNSTTITNVTDSTNGLYNVMSFDGSSSYITLSTNTVPATWDVTINWWLYQSNTTTWIWIDWNDWGANRWDFYAWTSWIAWYDAVWWALFWSWIEQNKWYMVTFIKRGSNRELWINWILNVSDTNASTLSWTAEYIWRKKSAASDYFPWKISPPKVWNRALSDQEVQQEYYSNKII